MNWLSNEIPRVARTIQRLVEEVKGAVADAGTIWRRIRVVLTRALMPHPEAQAAVMRAIEAEFVPG